jgi:hypothetical protein
MTARVRCEVEEAQAHFASLGLEAEDVGRFFEGV